MFLSINSISTSCTSFLMPGTFHAPEIIFCFRFVHRFHFAPSYFRGSLLGSLAFLCFMCADCWPVAHRHLGGPVTSFASPWVFDIPSICHIWRAFPYQPPWEAPHADLRTPYGSFYGRQILCHKFNFCTVEFTNVKTSDNYFNYVLLILSIKLPWK